MCRQVQTIHAPSPDCKRGELPRRGKRGAAPMRTGNPICWHGLPDAPSRLYGRLQHFCGVLRGYVRGLSLDVAAVDEKFQCLHVRSPFCGFPRRDAAAYSQRGLEPLERARRTLCLRLWWTRRKVCIGA